MWYYILLSQILFIYRHSCIVYLQGMRPIGVFTWTLVSLVVCLESLYRQSSFPPVPQAIVAPGMQKTQLCLNLLGRLNLVGPPARSLVMVILLHTYDNLKTLETYLVNITNDLNSPNIVKHFRETDTTQLI